MSRRPTSGEAGGSRAPATQRALSRGGDESSSDALTTPKATAFDPKLFLAKVGQGKTHTVYLKNRKIFAQGDEARAIFYIQKGKVKLTVVSNQGKEAVVAILAVGDFFGEGCLAGQVLRMATVTALT